MLHQCPTTRFAPFLLYGLVAFAGPCLANSQADTFLTQSSCRNFVRQTDGLVLLGADHGLTTIESDGRSKALNIGQSARDALVFGHEVIALVEGHIQFIDSNTGETISRFETQSMKSHAKLLPQEMPRAIGRIGQTLLVAHGTLGVILFDLTTHQIDGVIDINRGQKVEGMAQDIMIRDDDVYILVDNYQMKPLKPSQEFRGILRLDLTNRSVAERFAGLDPGATTAALFDHTILVSFAGMPIWKLQLPLASDSPLATAARTVSDFGRDGHGVGHFSFDDQFIWTCHRPAKSKINGPALYKRNSLRL